MIRGRTCLVDSDVFITAKNGYYSFEICPGFWRSLLHHHPTVTRDQAVELLPLVPSVNAIISDEPKRKVYRVGDL